MTKADYQRIMDIVNSIQMGIMNPDKLADALEILMQNIEVDE